MRPLHGAGEKRWRPVERRRKDAKKNPRNKDGCGSETYAAKIEKGRGDKSGPRGWQQREGNGP